MMEMNKRVWRWVVGLAGCDEADPANPTTRVHKNSLIRMITSMQTGVVGSHGRDHAEQHNNLDMG